MKLTLISVLVESEILQQICEHAKFILLYDNNFNIQKFD